jgi:hypothetical protein
VGDVGVLLKRQGVGWLDGRPWLFQALSKRSASGESLSLASRRSATSQRSSGRKVLLVNRYKCAALRLHAIDSRDHLGITVG